MLLCLPLLLFTQTKVIASEMTATLTPKPVATTGRSLRAEGTRNTDDKKKVSVSLPTLLKEKKEDNYCQITTESLQPVLLSKQ